MFGRDAPRTPQLAQRVFDREQRRLRVAGVVDGRGLSLDREQHFQQRPVEARRKRLRTTIKCCAEHRCSVVQLARHSNVLRALPGEEEGDARGVSAHNARGAQAFSFRSLRQGDQAGPQLADAVCTDRGASSKVGAAGVGSEADVGQLVGAAAFERGRVARREFRQGVLVAGGKRHQRCRPMRRLRTLGHGRGRFLDHDVGVGAAEAERADSADAPPANRLPRHRLRRHAQRQIAPGDVRARVVKVQVRRDCSVMQRKHELDEPRDARRGSRGVRCWS